MEVLAWIIVCVYFITIGLPIPLGAFALAISPAKGQTLKRMLIVFIAVAPAVLVVGLFVTTLLELHALARLTGLLFIPVGMTAGTITGWIHARSLRKQQTYFPSLSIRQ